MMAGLVQPVLKVEGVVQVLLFIVFRKIKKKLKSNFLLQDSIIRLLWWIIYMPFAIHGKYLT